MSHPSFILTINSGSSSIKFALFRQAAPLERVLSGKFERIGLPEGALTVSDTAAAAPTRQSLCLPSHAACVPALVELIESRLHGQALAAIAHRVVHGGQHFNTPQQVTAAMIGELRRLSPFVPEHLPSGLLLMETLGQQFPSVPQIACFDTAFHRAMPRVARLLPLPRHLDAKGIQRYGFHGLSYSFLLEELERLAGSQAARGRVLLAHLGNGSSLAAVRDGRCLDTTMSFSPSSGLVMATRSGDLDPGLFTYLTRVEGMTGEQFHKMINTQSGLLGVSGLSPDLRDLLACEQTHPAAAEAVDLFCYQTKKWIGALTAALGGLDTLVFAGGIGENAAVIRQRICAGLGYLGLELDPARNAAHGPVISTDASRATAWVLRTDEELYMARTVARVLGTAG